MKRNYLQTLTVTIMFILLLSFVAITPAAAFEPTGSYYKYAQFSTSDSVFKGGYDVGGYVHSDGTEYLFVGNGQNCDMYNVSIPAGSDPNMHPDNPDAIGPMAPRTLTYIGSYDYFADCGFSSGSINEFIVTEDAIYLGPEFYSSGSQYYAKIYKWTIDWDTLTWTPVGTVVDAKLLPQYYYTQTLGYDEDLTTFYIGTASDRNVLSFQTGVDTEWQWEFTHTTTPGGSHHDGLEYVANKLWISDMTSAYILEYEDTGTGSFNGWEEKNIFNYTGFPGYVEGMGFGPNQHFWATGGSYLFELGGGELQQELEGIPDQCIFTGEAFDIFDLDDHVSDPSGVDHYGYSGNVNLTASIDGDNNLTITYPDSWTGNETITFTAYNTTGSEIGTDDAKFTVCPVPVVGDIPDQTAPFEPFDLDEYLSGIDPVLVTWSASDPGDGWTVDINSDNVVTVTAPEDATEQKTITFTATTISCAGEANDIDDATFDIKPTPRKLKEDTIEKLKSAKTCDDRVNGEIDETIFLINKSLSDKLWINDTHLSPKLGGIVFAKEHAAVEHMQRNAIRMPSEVKTVFEEVIGDLLSADEMLALTAIEGARAYEGTSRMVDREIRLAERNLEEAYDEMDDPLDKDNAILRFGRAWEHAQRAIRLSTGMTLHTATTNEGGEISWYNYTETLDETVPVDPVPESATLASFTVGLITLVGYVGIKKKKN